SARYAWPHSSADHASGPMQSRLGDSGMAPATLMRCWVGFRPVRPHKDAGRRTDPPVSEPIAKGTCPAATDIAAPLELPPDTRSMFQGLRPGPRVAFQPVGDMANSAMCCAPDR